MPGLVKSIRDARVSLLAEHTRLDGGARERLSHLEGLVEYLGGSIESGSCCLRRHPAEAVPDGYQPVTSILPDGLPFDSDSPEKIENTYEAISTRQNSLFTQGLTSLKRWLQKENK